MSKPFYITTTLPYVNAKPHMGHALEFVRADVIARFKSWQGMDVFFNTGTDEHGSKLYEAAQKEGVSPQEYVDKNAEHFTSVYKLLGMTPDIHVIRTTEERHKRAAQKMWKLCNENGYIYKKNYQTKYCVGCELEKTDSELTEGKCPDHPTRDLELRDEENYFFAFSQFEERLFAKYNMSTFIYPETRANEMRSLIAGGLQDFSISRLKEKMPWGVPVPGDNAHVMYVWFDALTSYISTLGWASEDESLFNRYWASGTPVQYCGKDNTRQQTAMWQAMLMAAGLPETHIVCVNGFVTGAGGVKMSKSLGNVIDPVEVVAKYGTETLRFFVTCVVPTFEDGPCTMEMIEESYTSWLQNGMGNLTSRIMKLSSTHLSDAVDISACTISSQVIDALTVYNHKQAGDSICTRISALDKYIQETEGFKVIKVDEVKGRQLISDYVRMLGVLAHDVQFVLPSTSAKILECIRENKMVDSPLFPRLA